VIFCDKKAILGSKRVHAGAAATACMLAAQDIFALQVAAVAHDVGHPGFNNPFLEPLAYNRDLFLSLCRKYFFMFVFLRGAPPPRPPFKSAWRPPRFTDIFHQIQQE